MVSIKRSSQKSLMDPTKIDQYLLLCLHGQDRLFHHRHLFSSLDSTGAISAARASYERSSYLNSSVVIESQAWSSDPLDLFGIYGGIYVATSQQPEDKREAKKYSIYIYILTIKHMKKLLAFTAISQVQYP